MLQIQPLLNFAIICLLYIGLLYQFGFIYGNNVLLPPRLTQLCKVPYSKFREKIEFAVINSIKLYHRIQIRLVFLKYLRRTPQMTGPNLTNLRSTASMTLAIKEKHLKLQENRIRKAIVNSLLNPRQKIMVSMCRTASISSD